MMMNSDCYLNVVPKNVRCWTARAMLKRLAQTPAAQMPWARSGVPMVLKLAVPMFLLMANSADRSAPRILVRFGEPTVPMFAVQLFLPTTNFDEMTTAPRFWAM